jgi:hypothetical protein
MRGSGQHDRRRAARSFTAASLVRRSAALAAVIGPWDPYQAFTRAAYDLHSTLLMFSTFGARIQLALEKELAIPQTPAPTEAAPRVEISPLEESMSLTLGMRRIRWPLARLDQSRCAEMLQAFCSIASGEDGAGNAAAALLTVLNSPAEGRHREVLAQQLERELSRQVGGGGARTRLRNVCNLLAWYFDLEKAVCAKVRQVERRLNEALGRDCAAGDAAPVLAEYCVVPAWKVATQGLGVQVMHEPESAQFGAAMDKLPCRIPRSGSP